MKKIVCLICLQFTLLSINAQTFEGKVLDREDNQPIPFVDIYFPDLNTGTTTDDNGIFKIEHFDQQKIHIRISSIGYQVVDEVLIIDNSYKKTFYLSPSHYDLKEAVISASTGKLQDNNIVDVVHTKMGELEQSAPVSLAEAISNIAGVEQNTTGTGIGKPIIRGLSGNRIVTYAQGIRIENQQWGDEHGLGVGEIGIESVEVIKGPASLLYGSDALGGVLYFIDERYAQHNRIEASFGSKFLSNSLGNITDLGFKIHKNAFKFNLFTAYSSQADYLTSKQERVHNTRFDEKNIKSAFGFNTKNWIANFRYSYLQNHFGITEGADYTTEIARGFELPFQIIDNHNISVENIFFTDFSKLTAILGYTINYRREFEDDEENQALGMHLDTYTYNLKWSVSPQQKWFDFVLGSQGMYQKNKNNGDEILIPNAATTDVGAYVLANFKLPSIQFQAGIRADNRKINTETTQHILKFSEDYQGVTFSAGAVYKQDKTRLRANVSSGFRAPNTSELLSDGVHEGTNRYEKGNVMLVNEKATQVDFSFEYQDDHLQFSLNPFYNYIKNYIYLSPTEEVIDNSPVFGYLQTNAVLYGGEVGVHFHPHKVHGLHFESDLSVVMAADENKNPLPLIPQTKINTMVSMVFSANKKISITNVYVQHIYKFKQNRIGLFESTTNAYHLLNFGLNVELNTKNKPIEINLGVKNVLNTKYIDHLSRFKKLGIPNQGINFYVGVTFSIDKKNRTNK